MPQNRILDKMLERLFASLTRGPGLNCRPHSSRQRIDLRDLTHFGDIQPTQLLTDLLGPDHASRAAAKVAMPSVLLRDKPFGPSQIKNDEPQTPEVRAWRAQQSLLTKLRHLGDDAKTYEQDTGVHALNVGYPILSMPPGSAGGTRRILAPIAFIPLSMEVNVGRRPGIELTCRGQGVDMVVPNPALFAWLERDTGKQLGDIFADDEGEEPWREIADLIAWVADALDMDAAAIQALADPQQLQLTDVPLAKDLSGSPALLTSAVLGLFPMSNQGLLRDMREMIEADAVEGPVQSFIDVNADLEAADHDVPDADEPPVMQPRRVEAQRNVALADPCQSRTVELARTSTGLVMHGPPGTGKSQTITNIIGDHLARGERVLFVCDKRTALDVVANRLEHLGLGPFCALVHDPQRDQRDLYMSIRARLEELPQVKTHPRAESTLRKIDKELQTIHDELTATQRALMTSDGDQKSFHELIGKWLSLDSGGFDAVNNTKLQTTTSQAVEEHDRDIQTILDRAASITYASSPWPRCIGTTLDEFLSRPIEELRRQFASCLENARAADATRHESIPPFSPDDLAQQAALRTETVTKLQWVKDHADTTVRQRIAAIDPAGAERYLQLIESAAPHREVLTQGVLDPELVMTARTNLPKMTELNRDIVTLATYLTKASKWYAFTLIGLKRDTSRITTAFGLQRTTEDVQRLHHFLIAVRARYVLNSLIEQLTDTQNADPFGNADRLANTIEAFDMGLQARRIAEQDAEVTKQLTASWTDDDALAQLIDGLQRSPARAEAVAIWETSAADLSLFDPKWLDMARQAVRGGKGAGETINLLQSRFDDIESVLRVHEGLRNLPDTLRSAAQSLVQDGATCDEGLNVLMKGALAGELQRRIAADPQLSRLDDQRLNTSFARYSELENKKRDVVTDSIIHQWVQKQQARLLAGTGSRLNSDGADLRRRLFVRGKRAMRLRQVIASGRKIEGGDPLFDVCPIWMASPETVAQVFPREAVFDLVVFDEASQCKLEEALPVLTRAKRVVIAGDPKQLPPSRFFEAAVTTSEDEALETDQDLFEAQQGEVEDLLGAALNLQIQESYLDVHYRSRNADLIQFSNEQFYHSRLQAIPGHPANRTRFPPLTIHTANGMYVDRTNEIEAREVGRIVNELLRRAEPPSIGIACFNIAQRDLIADVLDEMANEDADFARRLATARERQGDGSFEGLFVKNLENVQGDERDHIIISTTYGPNAEGKFYRRFGPLGNAGGGRRLNVLVTRARHEVHLVTSIPQQVYRAVDHVPDGMHPSGGWLLFAYLRYAELLAEAYAENDRILASAQVSQEAQVFENQIQPASAFARALAVQLKNNRNISSDVHWGNAGFCVDAALHHPNKPEDVTVGLLCDFTRFTHAPDAVEWEVFRTGILQWQGWQLHRVWSPQYFRDAQRVENGIEQEAQRVAETAIDDPTP